MNEVVILYHANCTDGFAGAYAAWKKYGDNASYIPVFHREPYPEGLEGKNVYIIDFSYSKETNQEIQKLSNTLTIIDHHEMQRDAVTAADEYVFDTNFSGAGLAWKFFHPETEVPKLLQYIQEGDLYKFKLPNTKELLTVIHMQKHTFEDFDLLKNRFEDPTEFEAILSKGKAFREHWDYLINSFVEVAEKVSFEGYEVMAVNVPGQFRSDVGNALAQKYPPFAILWKSSVTETKVSLRGSGDIDLAEIAKKYGGGGHPGASSFTIKIGTPFPFTKI